MIDPAKIDALRIRVAARVRELQLQNIPLVFNGIQFRVVRTWDPIRNEFRQRMGRVCECGQMIPYFVQIEPLSTDWDNDSD